MGFLALGVDVDQYRLGPLFANPKGGIAIVVAVEYPVPRRQLRFDLPLKVHIRGDQADRGQGLISKAGGTMRIGHVSVHSTEQAKKRNSSSLIVPKPAPEKDTGRDAGPERLQGPGSDASPASCRPHHRLANAVRQHYSGLQSWRNSS